MNLELAGFLALATLMIGLFAWLRADARAMEERLKADTRDMEERLTARLERLEQGQGEVRERMAHLDGLLEGLRETITGRQPAAE